MKAIHQGHCSDSRAVCNVILSAIGVGIVSFPKSFADCGWLGGLVGMLIGVFVSNTAVFKLYYSIRNQEADVTSYESLGRHIGGRWVGMLTGCVVHVTMGGCCSVLLIVIGDCLNHLFPTLPIWLCTCIAGGCLTPLCWLKSLNEVGYISAIGSISIVALLIVIVIGGLTSPTLTTAPRALFIFNIESFSLSLCVAVFSFNIANTVPTLVNDMQAPSHFPRVALIGAVAIFSINLTICAAAYLGWGEGLRDYESIVKILLASEVRGLATASLVFLLLMAIPHYVVLFIPVANACQSFFPEFWLRSIVVRSVLVGVTIVVGVLVNDVKLIIDVLGAFTMSFIALILPVLFYVKTCNVKKERLSVLDKVQCVSILVVAVFLLTAGGYFSIKSAFRSK
jgi:amino acid permease